MRDDELLEQAQSLPLIYCDGFGAFRKVNGVLRAVGYIIGGPVQVHLAVSLAGADQSVIDAARALRQAEPVKCLAIWNGHDLAH
jgi:hypothetical protein